MESKLKALKVVDLKQILADAHVPLTGKANKADLIQKILDNPPALDVYHALHGPKPVEQDIQPPPADPIPAAEETPTASSPTASSEPAPPTTSETTPQADVDPELEKRKARAARFGIPLVEPKQKPAAPKKQSIAASATPQDLDALKRRAERFGIKEPDPKPLESTKQDPQKKQSAAQANKKRPAPPPEPVDAQELERRKKRAERFGLATPA
ncbi:hypothetical protein ABKN59_007851 [Abortiporus biennis]